ncbi:hypothetical protein WN943_010817 [Citrus x changshan-huyou]
MAATPNRQFKNICVLSGFNYVKLKEFVEAAIDLGRSITERKLHLVYGGGDLATQEALITLASWAHLYIHQKPIAKKLFICAHTANELLDLLQAYTPEPDPWTFVLERPNNDGNSSRNLILVKLHKRFPSLPQNALLRIYKARSERMRLLMRNNISADIRRLIKAKLRLAGELPPKFIAYMPGCGKGNYARKRRARRICVACYKCARISCDKNPRYLGMVSDNREDKIQFIRNDLNKESLDDILLSLETHPSGYVQGAILQLWSLFQKEHARYSLRNLTINDPNICVLSGFNYGKHKEFVEAAVDLGQSIAERKLHLVYGGGNRGLSKLVSEATFLRGSQVLGIIPRVLKPLGSLSDSPTGEELVVSGMQERITEMLNHADAFTFLLGDLATLEALITLASWAHLHIHQKPIGLLNVNNFYDGFIALLNHAIKNYFIPSNAKKLFICAHTANELLDLLQAYRPEPDP